jgi:hypothetical protein
MNKGVGMLAMILVVVASGCAFERQESIEDLGLQIRTECEGDCTCVMEIIGAGQKGRTAHRADINDAPTGN